MTAMFETGYFSLDYRVPKFDSVILAATGKGLVIRGKGQGRDDGFMVADRGHRVGGEGREIPELDRPGATTRSERLAIRRNGQAEYGAFVFGANPCTPTCFQIPNHHGLVLAAAGEEVGSRSEGEGQNRSAMPFEWRANQFAGFDFEELD